MGCTTSKNSKMVLNKSPSQQKDIHTPQVYTGNNDNEVHVDTIEIDNSSQQGKDNRSAITESQKSHQAATSKSIQHERIEEEKEEEEAQENTIDGPASSSAQVDDTQVLEIVTIEEVDSSPVSSPVTDEKPRYSPAAESSSIPERSCTDIDQSNSEIPQSHNECKEEQQVVMKTDVTDIPSPDVDKDITTTENGGDKSLSNENDEINVGGDVIQQSNEITGIDSGQLQSHKTVENDKKEVSEQGAENNGEGSGMDKEDNSEMNS